MLDIVLELNTRLGEMNLFEHHDVIIELSSVLLLSNPAVEASSHGVCRVVCLALLGLRCQLNLDVTDVDHSRSLHL